MDESERRETLHAFAGNVRQFAPNPEVNHSYSDYRKDEHCTDSVGIYLNVSENRAVSFYVSFGEEVQTLTRAMGYVLCRGLNGSPLGKVSEIDSSFIPVIVGEALIKLRSQTVYYVLDRMKEAAVAINESG